jgi:osmotically-inducible protein OsmY
VELERPGADEEENTMSNRMLTMIAAAGLALSGSASLGCAATRTSESTGEYVDDSAITTKVKSAILGEASLKSLQISVETFKGTVQLSGFVNSEKSQRKAGEVAGAVHGVTHVQNDLIVK